MERFYKIVKYRLLEYGKYYYGELSAKDLVDLINWLEDEGLNVVDSGGHLELESD